MEVFLLQNVVKGRQYYYQRIGVFGSRGEVFLVTAIESRNVGNVTVLVRFENGDEVRVQTDHLHSVKPKSPAELRQIEEAKNEAREAQWRKEAEEERRRYLADWERTKARLQSMREDEKRRHLEAQKRRRALEKIEKARAKRQHLEAQYRRRALEKKEKARAERQHLEAQKRKKALEKKRKGPRKTTTSTDPETKESQQEACENQC